MSGGSEGVAGQDGAILVVDDEPAVVHATMRCLARDRRVLGAHSLAEAHPLIETNCICGTVLDIGLKDGLGFELLGALALRSPGSRVLIATGEVHKHHDHKVRDLAREHGLTMEYCSKVVPVKVLQGFAQDAVLDSRERMARDRAYRARVDAVVIALIRKRGLTRRQGEVLACVGGGDEEREIPGKLGIRPGSVSNHLTKIFDALGVSGFFAVRCLIQKMALEGSD